VEGVLITVFCGFFICFIFSELGGFLRVWGLDTAFLGQSRWVDVYVVDCKWIMQESRPFDFGPSPFTTFKVLRKTTGIRGLGGSQWIRGRQD
jgi:hypothetical protein